MESRQKFIREMYVLLCRYGRRITIYENALETAEETGTLSHRDALRLAASMWAIHKAIKVSILILEGMGANKNEIKRSNRSRS